MPIARTLCGRRFRRLEEKLQLVLTGTYWRCKFFLCVLPKIQHLPERASSMVPPGTSKKVETRLLRLKQVAQYLNLHPEIIRQMVKAGQLKAIRRPGKSTPWLIDIRECDRWIEQNNTTRLPPRRW